MTKFDDMSIGQSWLKVQNGLEPRGGPDPDHPDMCKYDASCGMQFKPNVCKYDDD